MRFLRRRSVRDPAEGPLAEVLEAERAAAAALAAAKLEATAWLEDERLAIANAKDATLKALAARAAANEAAARQAASAEAETAVAAADRFSRQLRAFGDHELLPIVARHMASILPESEP